jgi:hypothetical protein
LHPDLPVWTVPHSYEPTERTFTFLNRRHRFNETIDWKFSGEGPLWTFNLNYFEWLYDESLSVADRSETITSFCTATTAGRDTLVYPASLRIMSWIWFELRHGVSEKAVWKRMFCDAHWLLRFPEYHLDGNHLFENAMAILTAGSFFRDTSLMDGGSKLLNSCIRDQICTDSGHCEGSPMYHSLLLWRLLQTIHVLRICGSPAGALEALSRTADGMTAWLRAVTFSDGTWPMVNDAAPGIAPSPAALFAVAEDLGLSGAEAQLSDSGYRMIRTSDFELFIDVGGIAPVWQPGHAHADTGSFCLHVRGQPVIVDTGTSTYDDLRIRQQQRGTAAHNTPVIGGADSSVLWSRFRVGRRCRILELRETPDAIYIRYQTAAGHTLARKFQWNSGEITITDTFPSTSLEIKERLHFHPGLTVTPDGRVGSVLEIQHEGTRSIELTHSEISGGFSISLLTACLLYKVGQQQCVLGLRILHK